MFRQLLRSVSLSAEVYHVNSCPSTAALGPGRIARHATINDILSQGLTKPGMPNIKEPLGLSRTNGREKPYLCHTLRRWIVKCSGNHFFVSWPHSDYNATYKGRCHALLLRDWTHLISAILEPSRNSKILWRRELSAAALPLNSSGQSWQSSRSTDPDLRRIKAKLWRTGAQLYRHILSRAAGHNRWSYICPRAAVRSSIRPLYEYKRPFLASVGYWGGIAEDPPVTAAPVQRLRWQYILLRSLRRLSTLVWTAVFRQFLSLASLLLLVLVLLVYRRMFLIIDWLLVALVKSAVRLSRPWTKKALNRTR